MAKKNPAKTKTPTPKTKAPKKLISKKKKLKKALSLLSPDSDTDSDTDAALSKLLSPLPKPRLVSLLASAAAADASLAARISAAADADVAHRKVFVHGLGWDAGKDTLAGAFGGFGEIEDCSVIADRGTGKSKGYGFVTFASRRGARKALREPNKMIGNRIASCQLAAIGHVVAAAAAAPAANSQQQDGTGRKIYVSNVPTGVDPEKLRTFFAKFGEIESGPLGFDSQTGKSRGFALFVYKTVESAKLAIQDQFKTFEGHQLRCQKAIEHKNKFSAGGAATITTAVQPIQPPPVQPMQPPPVLAAMGAAQQNPMMAMMSQQYQYPGLNPMYSGMFANSMMPAQLSGYGPTGLGQGSGYGSTGPSQVNKLGAGLGLQHTYLGASAGAAGGSFSGFTNPTFNR